VIRRPNPAPGNGAVASRFQFARAWRAVPEPQRSAIAVAQLGIFYPPHVLPRPDDAVDLTKCLWKKKGP